MNRAFTCPKSYDLVCFGGGGGVDFPDPPQYIQPPAPPAPPEYEALSQAKLEPEAAIDQEAARLRDFKRRKQNVQDAINLLAEDQATTQNPDAPKSILGE